MSDDDKVPSITIRGEQAGEVMSGVLDVMVALAVSLCNRGLIERQEIAAAMTRALEQLNYQDKTVNTAARRFPLETLRWFFSRSVMGGRGTAKLFAVDGGRVNGDGPPDAA